LIGHTPTEVLERQELLEEIEAIEATRDEWIVEAVLERNRFDVLAREVLGLEIKPFHRSLQRFALRHPRSLQLAFRGSGKTTSVTVVMCIGYILQNPNVRILISSRTHDLAKDILKEIKHHLEHNPRLIELFGEQKGDKWDTREIIVKGRTVAAKEGTISTIGTEGQVVGRHYDVIFGDDLVDESNARTPGERQKVKTFYYKTLLPTLEPDGELHIIGTRYHFDDLYGHLETHDMRESTQVIPALDEYNRSPWPERFPPDYLNELKVNAGSIIFDSQYQCDTKKMRGGIFQYDWMVECELSEVPDEVQIYHGADLAIGKNATSDYFAMVSIAVQGRRIWILDSLEQRLTFSKQGKTIADWHDRDDPVETGIEANAYQAALADDVAEKYPRVRPKKVFTKKNKDTRALKLAARFEADEVRFVKGNRRLIDHLVLYPRGSHDDLFDALDHAVSRAFKSRRRNRRKRTRKLGVL
jgi:predicted phage terminase large subunit-like protein